MITAATLYRLAVLEARTSDAGRQPGTAGRRDAAWVEHRYQQLRERYGFEDVPGGRRRARMRPHVTGYCPEGCGPTLHLNDDGTVVCWLVDCPNRFAANDLLSVDARRPRMPKEEPS